MSFSSNGNSDRHFPTITLGRYVDGCHLSSFRGKYKLKSSEGDLSCRIEGVDFDINVSLKQNTEIMRVVLKSMLAGTVPNGAEIDTDLLNSAIQKRVQMLLQTECRVTRGGNEAPLVKEACQSLTAPLLNSMREAGIWNKVDIADEIGFNLVRGDKLTICIRSIGFIDAEPSSLLGSEEHKRPKNS